MPEQFERRAEQRVIPERALRTRRARFLGEAARLFPWATWEQMIEPHYPRPRRGRPPYPLAVLLRLVLVQEWFALSNAALIDAATDSMALREFLGLGLTWDRLPPDEATLTKFRRLLSREGIAAEIAADIASRLRQQGWKLRPGATVEPSMVAE